MDVEDLVLMDVLVVVLVHVKEDAREVALNHVVDPVMEIRKVVVGN